VFAVQTVSGTQGWLVGLLVGSKKCFSSFCLKFGVVRGGFFSLISFHPSSPLFISLSLSLSKCAFILNPFFFSLQTIFKKNDLGRLDQSHFTAEFPPKFTKSSLGIALTNQELSLRFSLLSGLFYVVFSQVKVFSGLGWGF
jgi:hypothetical protein